MSGHTSRVVRDFSSLATWLLGWWPGHRNSNIGCQHQPILGLCCAPPFFFVTSWPKMQLGKRQRAKLQLVKSVPYRSPRHGLSSPHIPERYWSRLLKYCTRSDTLPRKFSTRNLRHHVLHVYPLMSASVGSLQYLYLCTNHHHTASSSIRHDDGSSAFFDGRPVRSGRGSPRRDDRSFDPQCFCENLYQGKDCEMGGS